MWHQYDWQQYACQKAFDRDPQAVWEFHNMRREAVAACRPNRAHEAIAQAEARLPEVAVVTQNIDGLHHQAGSERVHELHGSLWRVRCDALGLIEDNRDLPFEELRCGEHFWRPDIVWFGDSLRDDVITASARAIAACDLLVSIGTSAVVFPAAKLPMIAREAGATLIEVNPQQTPLSEIYDSCMRMKASEALDILSEGL